MRGGGVRVEPVGVDGLVELCELGVRGVERVHAL